MSQQVLTQLFHNVSNQTNEELKDYISKYNGQTILLAFPVDLSELPILEQERISSGGYLLRGPGGSFFRLSVKLNPAKGKPGNPNLLEEPKRID